MNRAYREQKYLKIDADGFISNPNQYHAYALGLIWADGHLISKYKKKEIRIEVVSSDMEEFIPVLLQTGEWELFHRTRSGRKPQSMAFCSNAKLVDFLIQMDFGNKSTHTPTKILEHLPEDIHSYFFRGWIDGDGCFYHNKKQGLNQFYLSGSYEQDWQAVETLFTKLNITFKIQRVVTKADNKYSCIRVTNKNSIEYIRNFIYSNLELFGLTRKFLKCSEIIGQAP